MDYRERDPIPRLAGLVRCVWTLTGSPDPSASGMQPILPDGCPEIVLHRGDAFDRVSEGGQVERQPAILFAGQLDRAITLRPRGSIEVIGLRFHPFGAAAVVRPPQSHLVGQTIGLEAVAPRLARALASALSEATLDEAASRVERALVEWTDERQVDPRVRAAVDLIGSTNGRVAIDRLAGAAGLTRRHLERRFLDTVGLSPKRLARIARFQQALALLERSDPARRGTTTAFACGYADQAHFIRDFRKLAGCPPGEHVLRQGEMTGFFVSGATAVVNTR